MRLETYLLLKTIVIREGFEDDITWAENIEECRTADDFGREHCFVVCNAGMRAKTAVLIFQRVMQALGEARPLQEVFRHEKKCAAIRYVHDHREELFEQYRKIQDRDEKLNFLETLPFIGSIVKFHLAKNLGLDIAKPDRHLVRIAAFYQTTPQRLCELLAEQSGDHVRTIDTVIWRCASLRIIRFIEDRPLIPSWPDKSNYVTTGCPTCSALNTIDIQATRAWGSDWQLCSCQSCAGNFIIEATAKGIITLSS